MSVDRLRIGERKKKPERAKLSVGENAYPLRRGALPSPSWFFCGRRSLEKIEISGRARASELRPSFVPPSQLLLFSFPRLRKGKGRASLTRGEKNEKLFSRFFHAREQNNVRKLKEEAEDKRRREKAEESRTLPVSLSFSLSLSLSFSLSLSLSLTNSSRRIRRSSSSSSSSDILRSGLDSWSRPCRSSGGGGSLLRLLGRLGLRFLALPPQLEVLVEVRRRDFRGRVLQEILVHLRVELGGGLFLLCASAALLVAASCSFFFGVCVGGERVSRFFRGFPFVSFIELSASF